MVNLNIFKVTRLKY